MHRNQSEVATLLTTVVNGGYCIGCGACTAVHNSPISVNLNNDGCFSAGIDLNTTPDQSNAEVLSVCPFSDSSLDEDRIAEKLYANSATYHDQIGYSLATYAGFVEEMEFRQHGSSGGMGKWILYELFKEGLVDTVIQVKQNIPTESDRRLYRYQVSSNEKEIRFGSKSAYYPVEMSGILQYIRDNPGCYAITGVPCFIKALRLLSIQEPIFKERVHFCIGIVCGHLKSTRYADMLAWQKGIKPDKLNSIDFRKKIPGHKAKEKGVEVIGTNDTGQTISGVGIVQEFFGTNYGHGFFKYNACDYCDDVTAEVADVSIGDAWLPQYVNDGKGTNAIIVRHPKIHKLIEQAISSGRLHLDLLTPDDIAQSQAGGLRHRREGLAYRLFLKDRAGEWRPKKRVNAQASHINSKFKQVFKFRIFLAKKSHETFKMAIEAGDFLVFEQRMQDSLQKYSKLYKSSLWQRLILKIEKKISGVKLFKSN